MKPQPIGKYTPAPSYEELQAEIERLRSVIRRYAEQDATLAIVNGVIYADDEAVCTLGHQ